MSRFTLKQKLVGLVSVAVIVLAALHLWSRFSEDGCCKCELGQIHGAKQEWAVRCHKSTNDTPTLADLQAIVFPGRPNEPLVFRCPQGGTYTIGRVGEPPRCSIGGPEHSLQ
jgi:hypothetical protein